MLELFEPKLGNFNWYLAALMLSYTLVYALLIRPLFLFCERFSRNVMASLVHLLFAVNLILPVMLLPMALLGDDFWLPGLLFILLYFLLLGAEGRNVSEDGKVMYLAHTQFMVFLFPAAAVLRLLRQLYQVVATLL